MALTNAERQARYRLASQAARKAIFEVRSPDGHVWLIHASGQIEGFPEGSIVINRITSERNQAIAEALVLSGRAA